MRKFVNPLLFNAHALPTDTQEPHAQVGNHLRVSHHPLFGLPITPFVVHRAVAPSRKRLTKRRDAVFLDRNQNVIAPPFDVTPGNPVTIRLLVSPTSVCIWAQVLAQATNKQREPIVISHLPGGRTRLRPVRPGIGESIIVRPPGIDEIFRPIDLPSPPGGIGGIDLTPKLTCEAFINSVAFGPATIGRRSEVPYAFSGPSIVEIRVTGTGRVGGIEWLDGHEEQKLNFEPWAIMNLPHGGGLRYLNILNHMSYVDQRIADQAPKRQPLQETLNAPTPNAAPPSNPISERARIDSLALKLAGDLDELINGTTDPLAQIIQEQVTGPGGVPLATNPGETSIATQARIERIQQLQLDPGTASLVGYKILDGDLVEVEDRIVFYQITGFFRDYPAIPGAPRGELEALFDATLAAVPNSERSLGRTDVFGRFIKLAGQIPDVAARPQADQDLVEHNDYVMLQTIAVADRAAPLDQVERPTITTSFHKDWLPAVPPSAVREVEAQLRGVRVAGLLAAGRRQPDSSAGTYTPINRKNADGFHLPLLLGLRAEDGVSAPIAEPGVGFISDRGVGPEALRTFVAQQDRFGRWSQWTSRHANAGPRPKPPRPHVQGYYQQPTIAAAATTGGTITVHVPVPDVESLAPGSFPLDRVRIFADDERGLFSQVFEVAESTKAALDTSIPPADRQFVVVLTFTGPVLDPTEQRRMILTARWIDTGNQLSETSVPHRLRMADPRPPAQITVPDFLLYSARPDVTGLSWVEHRWTTTPEQANFGIYYTDENRLLAHLESEGETALLADLDVAPDRAARAGVFRDSQALFPDTLYERLDDVAVTFNSGEVGFRHAVSGSSRILNAYKIAAEAEAGGRPILSDLDIILYGVPNSDPPQRPTVAVRVVELAAGENALVVEVTINVVAGTTIGQTWRLRRTRGDNPAPRKIPVVTSDLLPAPDPDTGIQSATYRDDGPVVIAATATLKPWTRCTWIAEIQGPPESGSTVPGLWSQPSDPVSLVLVPPDAPVPLQFGTFGGTVVAGGMVDLTIELTHPESLDPGVLGHYRLRRERRLPDGELTLLGEENITVPGVVVAEGTVSAGELVPFGTAFVLTLIDPIGRASAPLRLTFV